MLRIEASGTDAEGKLVAGFANVGFLEIFGEPAKEEFVILGRVFESQNDKFIATDARHDVGATEGAFQGIGGANEGEVSLAMAERIVDRLEIVEITEQEQESLGVAGGKLEKLRASGKEPATVIERSEVIGESEMAEFPIEESLFDRGPDGGVDGDAQGLFAGAI